MTAPDTQQLDAILALQLTVAWAGEVAAEPKRLGWWDTDLVDEAAGGDLFSRLLPKTAAWAGLQMAREAAIRTDATGRARLAKPDAANTLFHFGFELDEALQDRLEHHKRHASVPGEVLSAGWGVESSWDKKQFAKFLGGLEGSKVEDNPAGRKLKSGADPAETAQRLTAALLPLSAEYPLPFADMQGQG
ncbi:MAG: BREX-6 system BrxE protein [Polyangiaceae bacterium]|nr:BREX-6 system BrxE protein [Polyangiaceae bacterium]